jgi:hypothetical protein
MVVEAEALMAVAEVEVSIAVEAPIAAAGKLVKAAPMASDLMVEEATAEAADLRLAAT